MSVFTDDPSAPRGIPSAIFIEDVAAFVGDRWSRSVEGCESLLRQLHELYGKYKFMETKLVQQKKALLGKIPEIKAALAVLAHLDAEKAAGKDEVSAQFELSDAVYVKAEVKAAGDSVMLWLGANVMVEYTRAEAAALLQGNLTSAEETVATLTEELGFLKDQVTVSEVNIARVHNYKVSLMQQGKKEEQDKGK